MSKSRLLAATLTGAILTTLLYASALVWGQGGRTYFSPHTLETWSQWELCVPLTSVPIYRSSLESHRYKLVEYLIEQGFWAPVPSEESPPLVSHSGYAWQDGQALIHQGLAWRGEDWIEWTESHPDMAAVLWTLTLENFARIRTMPFQSRLA